MEKKIHSKTSKGHSALGISQEVIVFNLIDFCSFLEGSNKVKKNTYYVAGNL